MSKYAIDEKTLRDISDAIRAKTDEAGPISGADIASKIASIKRVPQSALEITGDCSYRFFKNGFNWFINEHGSHVTTHDISNCESMFENANELKEIPFDINCKSDTSMLMHAIFMGCRELETIPKITGCKPSSMSNMFTNCVKLRELPEDIADWFDWSAIESSTHMFYNCQSLRKIPMSFLEHQNLTPYSTGLTYLRQSFYNCASLDELVGLPIPFTNNITSSLWASDSFAGCGRLKNLTFALDPNTNAPYIKKWSAQTLYLQAVGVTSALSVFDPTRNTSGITTDTLVNSLATYNKLKDNPDWWTNVSTYSRYNHDSAVATINSLPDTSAFVSAGNTANTIFFKGDAGSGTTGGAINTLKDSEIAVATAKGWTVSFA